MVIQDSLSPVTAVPRLRPGRVHCGRRRPPPPGPRPGPSTRSGDPAGTTPAGAWRTAGSAAPPRRPPRPAARRPPRGSAAPGSRGPGGPSRQSAGTGGQRPDLVEESLVHQTGEPLSDPPVRLAGVRSYAEQRRTGSAGSARAPDRTTRTAGPIRASPRAPAPVGARCRARSAPPPPGRASSRRACSPAAPRPTVVAPRGSQAVEPAVRLGRHLREPPRKRSDRR